jgi:hypothetical protein
MKKCRNLKGPERLNGAIVHRISASQGVLLERKGAKGALDAKALALLNATQAYVRCLDGEKHV